MKSEKWIKRTLIILAAAIAISCIAAYCFSVLSDSFYRSSDDRIMKAGSLAADAAEFGNDWNAENPRFKNFMDITHGNANIIIADAGGKILFNYSKAYISDDGFFRIMINENIEPGEDSEPYKNVSAFIANPKGEALYRLLLSSDTKAEGLPVVRSYHQQTDQDYKDSLIFRPLPARKAFVFLVYRNDRNSYKDMPGTSEYRYAVLETITAILGASIVILMTFFWMLLPVWVAIDCKREKTEKIYPVVLTVFTNIIGLGVYLVLRKKDNVCAGCLKSYHCEFTHCPHCGKIKMYE